ncbi:hypothetical protein IKG54_01600 [Candidatus Saccharibacteria bacterium]|nr:hypothetical protein [Candidatus Saccharibacteria bacterium]
MAKKPSSFKSDFKSAYTSARSKKWAKKSQHFRPHKSFHRSYREDYQRELAVPGLLSHAVNTFKTIFKNWKIFLPLIILAVIFNILLVGLMNEDTYTAFQDAVEETNQNYAGGSLGNFAKAGLTLMSVVATGGLSSGLTETQVIFLTIIFLIIWLVTVYIVRHYLAGHKIKLRDALYNALTPLLSTLVVLIVFLIQLLPVVFTVIIYSAAVQTVFLSTPFYALVFFIFASLMILLSLYLISSTAMALVAVTAPGLYPMKALSSASDLIMGRRIKLIIRILFLIFVVAIVYVVFMLPLILLDMWAKSTFSWLEGIPFVSVYLLIATVFAFIYSATYLYLYYRRMLNYDNQK